MNYIFFILIGLGSVIVTVGDIVMRKWVATNEWLWYGVGLAFYFIGLNFLAQSYRHEHIAVSSIIFVLFNIIVLTVASKVFFGDSLSWQRMTGLGLGIAAVAVLTIGK